MRIETRSVHVGDRKQAAPHTPSTTPIHLSSSFFYQTTEELDKVFAQELQGQSYSRYGNPTNAALEEVISSLENGDGTLACSSGMAAMQLAITAALLDRRKSIVAASALYGASLSL
ncbi:MAG TPA: PLP-dependent transferase, partial [Bryobacteraceae bacterium]|nr:PLP-dependent transferase [Bryobacteraceae bacterium]